MLTRREMLSHSAAAGAALSGLRPLPSFLLRSPAPRPARPTAAQRAWQDLELGMFVHFAPNTWQEKEYDDLSLAPGAIMENVDTEQWVDTALSLGARYIVLVAKHAGGFCLWQTETTDYSIKNSPWKGGRGDVMASLADACGRRGLQLGVYLSPRDDKHGAGLSGKCATPAAQPAYDELYRRQLTELLSHYGPIVELWLDGSSVVPTGDIVARYQPGAMVFQGPEATIRWVGNEDGFAPSPCWNGLTAADAKTGIATALQGDPDGDVWMPVEVDVSIRRPNWFWNTTDEANLLTVDQLIEIYYRSVGRGTQLLLNMPPDRTGRIPALDAARAGEFGDEIRRRFSTTVGEGAVTGRELVVSLGTSPQRVDHVILQEAIAQGERVRGWHLEGYAWEHWQPLATGTAIGHKQIVPVTPDGYTLLRLTVTDARDEPIIQRLAAFNTGKAPPQTWADQAQLWADNAVGKWHGDTLTLDLTPHVQAAGQYELRLLAPGTARVEIKALELSIRGAPQPALARAAPGRKNTMILTIPEANDSVTVRVRLREAAQGTALLQKL
ncbi:MAG TPA: alpha-L-fucosidase [Gemmatimonadales bacterium]|nr:alpha-L-fucosidase [Gemmatimonadales bacterium]